MNAPTALITGASSGIGLHLAHEFARNGHPLVLVAPVIEELLEVAFTLREEHSASVHVIAKDLEEPYAAWEIFTELQSEGIHVGVLVNNAGHGFRGNSWDISIEQDISMVRLNVEAALRLTKLFLPAMLENGSGRILNTVSIAGFEPGPLMAVYHATKAFMLSWSEALATELEHTPVTVTALCPGATDTDFFPKAQMMGTRAFQGNNVMAPQDVARDGYRAAMAGEHCIVPGGMNKALVFARRLLPQHTQARMNQKFYENVPLESVKRVRGELENAQ